MEDGAGCSNDPDGLELPYSGALWETSSQHPHRTYGITGAEGEQGYSHAQNASIQTDCRGAD